MNDFIACCLKRMLYYQRLPFNSVFQPIDFKDIFKLLAVGPKIIFSGFFLKVNVDIMLGDLLVYIFSRYCNGLDERVAR